MTLAPRALQILADLKRELLSRDTADPAPAKEAAKPEPAKARGTQRMRHARTGRAAAFQRACRRGDFFTSRYKC